MMTAGAPLHVPDKRRDYRVPFTRTVKVSVRNRMQGHFSARNLSQGGLFFEGNIDLPIGGSCRVELCETGRYASMSLAIHATVQRKEEDGVGLRFTNMEDDTFMFLQTMMLYSAQDPIQTAEHFMEGFAVSVTSRC